MRDCNWNIDLFERWILGGTGHREWACRRANGQTLEVAIGTGLNLLHYPAGMGLTGLDTDPQALARAAERAEAINREVDLVVGDAGDLPFPDETFDTVICTHALCSVGDDRHALAEMKQVLKPEGQLILVDHVRSSIAPLHWLQWLYEFIPSRTKGEYMTRRPAAHLAGIGLRVVASDRLRAGILERLVAEKD
ncbi:MAG TPA: class I SAM-dependent methyltransferase [Acidimicrobiia bacterium]